MHLSACLCPADVPWTDFGEIVAGLTGAKTQKKDPSQTCVHVRVHKCNFPADMRWCNSDNVTKELWSYLSSQGFQGRSDGKRQIDTLTQSIRICRLVHSRQHLTTTFRPFTGNIGNCFSENTEGLMDHSHFLTKYHGNTDHLKTSFLYAQYRSSVMYCHGDVEKLNKKPKINQSKGKGTEIWSMGERRPGCKSMCICLQC